MTSVSGAAAHIVTLLALFEQRSHAAVARKQVVHEAALQQARSFFKERKPAASTVSIV